MIEGKKHLEAYNLETISDAVNRYLKTILIEIEILIELEIESLIELESLIEIEIESEIELESLFDS